MRPRVNHAVCFPVFPMLARATGSALLDSGGLPGATRTVVLAADETLSEGVRREFDACFLRTNHGLDWIDFERAARRMLETGDVLRALRFFERCIALDPYSPSLLEAAADAWLALGAYERAVELKKLMPDEAERVLLQTKGTLRGPTIIEWLMSIIDPRTAAKNHRTWDDSIVECYDGTETPVRVDELRARDSMSRGMVAFDSIPLGRLGPRGDCVLLEFRRWPLTSLPTQYWLSLAARLFDLYRAGCQ